ncbi:MAG: hypothetical protein H6713_01450 [Myxococcales bacterium]|nr:hypothetical protein [Myxococcales bacterium]
MPRSPRSLLIAPPLALALALLLPAPAPALAASSPDVERLAGARARAHLAAARPLPSDLSLETQRVYRWAAGAHVHLEQRVRGVPVANHRVIVSLDPALRPCRVRGAPLTRAALDVTPTLAPAEAEARAARCSRRCSGRPRPPSPGPHDMNFGSGSTTTARRA